MSFIISNYEISENQDSTIMFCSKLLKKFHFAFKQELYFLFGIDIDCSKYCFKVIIKLKNASNCVIQPKKKYFSISYCFFLKDI